MQVSMASWWPWSMSSEVNSANGDGLADDKGNGNSPFNFLVLASFIYIYIYIAKIRLKD